jgi:hypothetical protein
MYSLCTYDGKPRDDGQMMLPHGPCYVICRKALAENPVALTSYATAHGIVALIGSCDSCTSPPTARPSSRDAPQVLIPSVFDQILDHVIPAGAWGFAFRSLTYKPFETDLDFATFAHSLAHTTLSSRRLFTLCKFEKVAMPNKNEHGARAQNLRSSTTSNRADKPKPRTSNACEACKRRKTKVSPSNPPVLVTDADFHSQCSGGPSPCNVCKRAETFCNFNPKLDTRRKVAYSSSTIQDRQQYMITGLLKTLKHAPEDDMQELLSLIRGPSQPDAVASCLQKQFATLKTRGLLHEAAIDDTDVISFGLQAICGHRKGRARPLSPIESEEVHSPEKTTPSSTRSDWMDNSSELDVQDSTQIDPLRILDSPTLFDEDSMSARYLEDLDSQAMFERAVNEPQKQLPEFGGLAAQYGEQRPNFDRTSQSHSSANTGSSEAYPNWRSPLEQQRPPTFAPSQLYTGSVDPRDAQYQMNQYFTHLIGGGSSMPATSPGLGVAVPMSSAEQMAYGFPLRSNA